MLEKFVRYNFRQVGCISCTTTMLKIEQNDFEIMNYKLSIGA